MTALAGSPHSSYIEYTEVNSPCSFIYCKTIPIIFIIKYTTVYIPKTFNNRKILGNFFVRLLIHDNCFKRIKLMMKIKNTGKARANNELKLLFISPKKEEIIKYNPLETSI